MSQMRLDGRTLNDAMAEADEIIEQAIFEHKPRKTFLLISGGNDSMVLLHFAERWADAAVHVNTGIGIPQTNEFVREQVALTNLPLLEYRPPVPYDELVLNPKYFGGFPGAFGHRFAYQRLKERCIRQLIRDHREKRGDRFLLLTGIRKAESARRMGYSHPVDRQGAEVWCNPLLFWENHEMREYREQFGVATSEVAANLHMSGECLCGAFAHPGELDEIAFFYPEVAARIRDLERRAREAGLRYCEWGVNKASTEATGPMCSSCDARQESFDV